MRIITYSENRHAVELTARMLNEPAPPGKVYLLPVPGPGLTSLYMGEGNGETFRMYLRQLFEEWLRCGKKIMPTDSNVWATGMGSYDNDPHKTTWRLYLVPEGMGTRPREELKPVDESDPAFSSWLWKVYWDYLAHRKPTIWFDCYGAVFFKYMTPAYEAPTKPAAIPPFLDAESAASASWSEAVLWFILVLNSGYAQLLDKCSYCERFFIRQREMKKGQFYKRSGPTCSNCKGHGSKARTESLRSDAKDRMLNVAARVWARWTPSHRAPDRHEAVAKAVNAECRDDIYVTTRNRRIETRWAKRNEREIANRAEQIVQRGRANKNAKG